MDILTTINLIAFLIWVGIIIYLGAKPVVKAFNREFVGLLLTAAFLFQGSVSEETFLIALLAFLGIRTYQKKLENGNGKPAKSKNIDSKDVKK